MYSGVFPPCWFDELPAIQDAQDKLGTQLTSEDRRSVQNFYSQLGRMINWEGVRKDILPEYLAYTEDLAFMGGVKGSSLYKKSAFPMSDDLMDDEDRLFSEENPKGQQMKHLLTLRMGLKIVGLMRQSLKTLLADIPQLSKEDEEHYREILKEAGLDEDVTVIEPGYQESSAQRREVPRGPTTGEIREVVADLERAEETSLARSGKCGENDHHAHTVDERVRIAGGVERILRCKDCGGILLREEFKFTSTKDASKCKHDSARWNTDGEGSTAHCKDCQEPVDPEEYDWNGGGLEEIDDDPRKDKVITLCSEY